MSGLETVTSSVEDVLIDSLQFKPAPGASYLTAKRNTRWHASGSDTYSSTTIMTAVGSNLFEADRGTTVL